jgi:hypothetical protein
MACALIMMVTGYYMERIEALQQNPVTKVKIVPRTMYEDQMGITWTSEAGAPLV